MQRRGHVCGSAQDKPSREVPLPETVTPTLTGQVQAEEGPGLTDSGLAMMR